MDAGRFRFLSGLAGPKWAMVIIFVPQLIPDLE